MKSGSELDPCPSPPAILPAMFVTQRKIKDFQRWDRIIDRADISPKFAFATSFSQLLQGGSISAILLLSTEFSGR